MNPEEKNILKRTLALEEENNKILHKLQNIERRRRIWKILYWIFILAISFGSFYFLQPFIENIRKSIPGNVSEMIEKSNLNNPSLKIPKLFKPDVNGNSTSTSP